MILGFQKPLVVGQIYRDLEIRINSQFPRERVPFKVMRQATRDEARARAEEDLQLTAEEVAEAYRTHEIMGYDYYYDISVD